MTWSRGLLRSSNGWSPSQCAREFTQKVACWTKKAEDPGVDEAAHPVTPAETADQAWEDQAHEEDDLEVVLVLPDDNGIVVQVRDVGTANSLRVLLHDHPPEVRVEQTLPDAVWVLVGVGVAVVRTVVASPPC